jgi:hypothetical protein
LIAWQATTRPTRYVHSPVRHLLWVNARDSERSAIVAFKVKAVSLTTDPPDFFGGIGSRKPERQPFAGIQFGGVPRI